LAATQGTEQLSGYQEEYALQYPNSSNNTLFADQQGKTLRIFIDKFHSLAVGTHHGDWKKP